MKRKLFIKERLDESRMWVWYWDVKFHIEPLDKDMRMIYKYYEYRHKNEKFINNKVG